MNLRNYTFETGKLYKKYCAGYTVTYRVEKRGRRYMYLYSCEVDFKGPIYKINANTHWQLRDDLAKLYKTIKIDTYSDFEYNPRVEEISFGPSGILSCLNKA